MTRKKKKPAPMAPRTANLALDELYNEPADNPREIANEAVEVGDVISLSGRAFKVETVAQIDPPGWAGVRVTGRDRLGLDQLAEFVDTVALPPGKVVRLLSRAPEPPTGTWWMSWYTQQADPDDLPFECRCTGETVHDPVPWATMVAEIDAPTREEAFALVQKYYPDALHRMSRARDKAQPLSDRFPRHKPAGAAT